MLTKEQFIVEVWEGLGSDVVGASDLDLIQDAVAKRFGSAATPSPALIARVLADEGAQLAHPQILQADSRWREQRFSFSADDLVFDTLDAAIAFIEKVNRQDPTHERLRLSVQQVKTELEVLATSQKVIPERRALAREAAQWLTVWLQNPQIFSEWFALRRDTAEFQQLFGTFARP